MIKLPDISIARSGTQLVVTLDNFEAGDTWNVYLRADYISGFTEQVRGHDQPSYNITGLDAGANYILRVSLNDSCRALNKNVFPKWKAKWKTLKPKRPTNH